MLHYLGKYYFFVGIYEKGICDAWKCYKIMQFILLGKKGKEWLLLDCIVCNSHFTYYIFCDNLKRKHYKIDLITF